MREFLKGLDLDSEIVDKIMAEYGKNVTNLKETIDSKEQEIAQLKQDVTDYEEAIQSYNEKIEGMESEISEKNQSLENLEKVTNENKSLKAEIQMNGSNVKKEFSKFVTSEVMSKVNDDTDFETALNDYKKENPQYFGESVIKKVQSSPVLNGGTPQPKTTNDIMNDLIRGASGEE